MKIIKTNEETRILIIKKSITHDFLVNGKKVTVREYVHENNIINEYENDADIIGDTRHLTNEELEAIGENLTENLLLEVGEETIIE
jgi:hypothetical protein